MTTPMANQIYWKEYGLRDITKASRKFPIVSVFALWSVIAERIFLKLETLLVLRITQNIHVTIETLLVLEHVTVKADSEI